MENRIFASGLREWNSECTDDDNNANGMIMDRNDKKWRWSLNSLLFIRHDHRCCMEERNKQTKKEKKWLSLRMQQYRVGTGRFYCVDVNVNLLRIFKFKIKFKFIVDFQHGWMKIAGLLGTLFSNLLKTLQNIAIAPFQIPKLNIQ